MTILQNLDPPEARPNGCICVPGYRGPEGCPEHGLLHRVARHIGAAEVVAGQMRCPRCAGLDFGPTEPLATLGYYERGYLPGAPLLVGVCLDCGYITEPKPRMED